MGHIVEVNPIFNQNAGILAMSTFDSVFREPSLISIQRYASFERARDFSPRQP